MDRIEYPQYANLFDWKRLYSISPNDIRWALTSAFEVRTDWNKVFDGDWDTKLPIEEDFVQSSIKSMIIEGILFEQTPLCQYSIKEIKKGHNRWGCTTEEQFVKRGEHIITLYNKIKQEGYKSQEELLKEGNYALDINGQLVDEPGACIDRNGQYLYHNGNHRLAIFRLLNIPEIKMRVNVRHKEWVEFLLFVKKVSEPIWGKNKIYQPVEHVDFRDYTCEWTNYRINRIAEFINKDSKTLLDIGALWGDFSTFFSKNGINCTAVEMNKDFSYIMNKLRIMQNTDYKIITDNVFNLKTFDYDIVLALNIFHHFLKREETYYQLINLLQNLKMKEMYFQPHQPSEGQMIGAYKNYEPHQFIDFLMKHTGINNAMPIGEENGRKLYRLWRT